MQKLKWALQNKPIIKRSIYFGNPAYLKTKDEQLIFESAHTGELKSL